MSYAIEEAIKEISRNNYGWRKQINLVSWDGNEPVYDIRDWAPDLSRPGRGVRLNEMEAKKVYEELKKWVKKAQGVGSMPAKGSKQQKQNGWANAANFVIIEKIKTISLGEYGCSKQINVVKWYRNPPKLDIREWSPVGIPKKGVTLDSAEALQVYQVLKKRLEKPSAAKSYSSYDECEEAAAAGDRSAMLALGDMYADGSFVGGKNYKKAFRWYKEYAIAGGDADYLLKLSECVEQWLKGGDLEKAEGANMIVECYRLAADMGNGAAMHALGDMYYAGTLVKKDRKKAFAWYKEEALAARDVEGLLNLAFRAEEWRKDGDLKAEAEEIAECYKFAAKAGDARGMRYLARCYDEGFGVESDTNKAKKYYDKAVKLFEKQVAAGDFCAMFELGTMYEFGEGVKEDENKAFSLYEQARRRSENSSLNSAIFEQYLQAAYRGNTVAISRLGDMYYFGWGTEVNYGEAVEWYENAAKDGLGFFAKIGDLYRAGMGVDQDYKKARERYEKGAAEGEVKAMLALADMYFLGLGVEKNYKKYLEWQEKAEEKISFYSFDLDLE